MQNSENRTHPDIREILDNQNLSQGEKISALKELYDDQRALQRAATESSMNTDDGLNDRLQDIIVALDGLGADTDGSEDNLGATL